MGRRQVEAQLKNHGQAPEVSTAPVPEVEDDLQLDDPQTQDRIFNPQPRDVELSFETIKLFPYSVRDQRRAYGFAVGLTADAARGSSSPQILGLRMASILNSNESMERELMRLVSIARRPAGELPPNQVDKLANELGSRCQPEDLVVLFGQVCELAGVKKQLPKLQSAPAAAT